MKILFDNIIYSKTKNGGVSNYWFELSNYLLKQTQDEIGFFEENLGLLNYHRKMLSIPSESIIPYGKFPVVARLFPIQFKSEEKFIYHSSYYRGLVGSGNMLEITTVHDFIHDYYSSFLKKKVHNSLKYNAIKRSKGVICVSKNTCNDLRKFCPTKPNQKVEVIYNGVSDDYFPLKEFSEEQLGFLKNHQIENNYLLFIGGRSNYKNFNFVSAVLNENTDLKLVVLGGGDLNVNELKLFSKSALERVKFISSADNNELNVLFNTAMALIYPSSYEGFGIPVIEAMRAGCPVIGLNNATIREIAEKSALLLDNLNIKDFENQKLKLNNLDYRQKIIEIGLLESQKYSWEKCSRETHAFYKDLYDLES